MYCLAVQAGFYSDAVECLTATQEILVRSSAGTIGVTCYTKAYEETSIDEKSVVYSHSNEIPNKFVVDVKERQDRLPTMYWSLNLHKRPYKARFIANSSSCTTTELSKLLTSCLTAIKA